MDSYRQTCCSKPDHGGVGGSAKKEPTVRRLIKALSVPEFMDVKLRVETLLERNYEDMELNKILGQLS